EQWSSSPAIVRLIHSPGIKRRVSLFLLLVLLKRSLATSEVDELVIKALSPSIIVFYLSLPYGRVDLLILSVYLLVLSSVWFLLRKRLFQMINDLPTIFEVVRTMMSMVALVALAETTSVQMSFGFAATSVRNGSMEDV
ncbi:unnamed protein product, partial [Brassica rapa subsp. narinosa]